MKTALVFLALVALGMAQDKTAESGDISAKIMGKSGKLSITKGGKKGVTFEYDGIKEVDADGKDVKVKSGNQEKHSFNTFANLDFTMTGPEDKKIPSESGDTGPNSVSIEMKGTIADLGNAQMTSYVYVAKEEGSVTFNGETNELKNGSCKFSVELKSWKWCTETNCDTNGSFVDLQLAIKAPKVPSDKPDKSETGKPLSFNIGEGAIMELSKKVRIDSKWEDMPEGYPKIETQGSKTLLTFRFRKFATSAFYDPTVSYDENGGNTSSAQGLAVSMVMTLMMAAIVSLF